MKFHLSIVFQQLIIFSSLFFIFHEFNTSIYQFFGKKYFFHLSRNSVYHSFTISSAKEFLSVRNFIYS